MLKLFSPAWQRGREAIAQRMAAQADERRQRRAECIRRDGKKAVADHRTRGGDVFVVPDYLNSAGMTFQFCRRCKEWIRVAD